LGSALKVFLLTGGALKGRPAPFMRDWKLAKVWLLHEMQAEKHHEARAVAAS
jgi:hypothetical protein